MIVRDCIKPWQDENGILYFSLLVGLYPFAGSMITMINVTGDAVVTTIVASRTGQIDDRVFYGK